MSDVNKEWDKIWNVYTPEDKVWDDPNFDEELSLELSKIEPSVAGPKRPQDKIFVRDIPQVFKTIDDAKFDKSASNKKLQSGYYQIDPQMDVMTFLENISRGNVVTTKVTLIEGKTLNDYFDQLSSDSSLRSEDTLEEIMQSLDIKAPYDGWFYPETYQFNYGESVRNVLARSFQVMQGKVNELWTDRTKNLPFKSPYEAIILASLIEKETALDQEKTLISGVFIRRLEQGMRLQTDPTVIYALGDTYQAPLKKSDLKVDSLYNTYKYNGLPPGAISSVGYESLYAAFHPNEGNDIYFVSKKDGSHAFASNYEEHKDNIKRYSNNI